MEWEFDPYPVAIWIGQWAHGITWRDCFRDHSDGKHCSICDDIDHEAKAFWRRRKVAAAATRILFRRTYDIEIEVMY